MPEEGKSLTWVVTMMILTIAVFGWGILASSYTGAHSPSLSSMTAEELKDVRIRRPISVQRAIIPALIEFVGNGFVQLPNFPSVISWHLANRQWLLITLVVLEVGVLVGAFALKRVENALEAPSKRKKRRFEKPRSD